MPSNIIAEHSPEKQKRPKAKDMIDVALGT